jgi:hypothetical protein
MSRTLMIALAAVATLGTAGEAAAQLSAQTPVNIRLVRPVRILSVQDLNFGVLFMPASSGTAVVAANGERTLTGMTAYTGTPKNALFTIDGDGGMLISVTWPTQVTVSGKAGTVSAGQSMTVAMVDDGQGNVRTLGGGPGDLGALPFGLGGSVSMSSTQVPGIYQGTVTVNVAYN